MAVSEVLQNFRKEDYGTKKEEKPENDSSESSGPRIIQLTEEEAKELQGYAKGPGVEQECLVTGRLGENGEFSVSSVHSPEGGTDKGGDQEAMMKAMMGPQGGPPLMQNQTMPSPS